ncbi:imidazolonepropionase [Comamonas flocculans]|uniref:Imidazolonepropionase n=1 Tax=Comamonas flocculans TaxID=2597701 RepID=A0A5B8RSW5_9BURK|nr:imidazolonepropionase [Comamonas flocculans]QEA12749.1 imidazolonepropionase [Comamonas flocculans]
MQKLWRNARLATLAGEDWALVEDGAIVTEGELIHWLGPVSALPAGLQPAQEIDLGGALLTPGLVDCHTHLVYGGDRAREAEMRLNGASYEEIARAGGGIRSTVAATRAAPEDALLQSARQRAQALMAGGVTTLEIKSGYGLSLEAEARCLRVARRLGRELALEVRTSFLGAHALAPEFEGCADDYIDAVCAWLPALHAQGLVDAVDAFCETIGFTSAQVARVFETARSLGLPVKLHAEQLSDQGGAQLAASFGALSADHLEHLGSEGIAAMQAAGTVAVLLPAAYYMLRETRQPPIAELRTAGVPMAVASDHNPGTAPGLSLLLAAHMACTFFRLTPREAVGGITHQAARALGLPDRGVLRAGLRADFAAWELNHPNELVYWFGHNPCRLVVQGGRRRD